MAANFWFWMASFAAAVTFAVHTFMGSPVVARPLLADRSLPTPARWLAYYCWHITTVLLVSMAIALAVVAQYPEHVALGWYCAALALALALLSALVARMADVNPLRLPSTSLFAITALLGFGGLWQGWGT